jgi:molybdopterin synthase catalytic subunit
MFVHGAIPDKLTSEIREAENTLAGAIAVFAGRVRADQIEGNSVEWIEFTAQQALAEQIAARIIEEGKNKFGILRADIWHSLGKVKTGDVCFLVKVVGKHRAESFAALSYIVDEVKSRCPVFGKEMLTGGKYRWKENKV